MSQSVPTDPAAAPRPAAVRMFGRFQLLRLLGKSQRTMAWAVTDTRDGHELMLMLPRVQPVGSVAIDAWLQAVNRGARLKHPNLAHPAEVGVQEAWPFAAYDSADGATLADRLPAQGFAAAEAAALVVQALQGLAFAHEGGVAHQDPQAYMMLVNEQGQLRVAGLEVAAGEVHAEAGTGVDAAALRTQRDAAQRDVLAIGVLMHLLLTGQPALDEPDAGRVIERLPPAGRDIVRLPWGTAQPVPEALRAIVNRGTDRQERQRYRNPRTLARALEGWLQTEADGASGPMALLQDKMRTAGVLPSSPGAAAQAARLALMETQRTNELAEVVLQDLALSFELLRAVNTAQVRGAQVAGGGPVLTVRRAIAMLGLNGVRRAALALRPWPGPLNEAGAMELDRLIARVKRAGRLALALRPAGYDGEVVYLITLLQNLGRLVVQYHFAEESTQIRRLMQPAPSAKAGEPDEPGMSEEAAAFAVLGADIESIGAAVARYWGLDDSVLHMTRRLPLAAQVRSTDNDDDLLRLVASAANESIDALALPQPQVAPALQRVLQRYGRMLNVGGKELQAALADSAKPNAAPLSTPTAEGQHDAGSPRRDTAPVAAGPGGLRAAAAARSAR